MSGPEAEKNAAFSVDPDIQSAGWRSKGFEGTKGGMAIRGMVDDAGAIDQIEGRRGKRRFTQISLDIMHHGREGAGQFNAMGFGGDDAVAEVHTDCLATVSGEDSGQDAIAAAGIQNALDRKSVV